MGMDLNALQERDVTEYEELLANAWERYNANGQRMGPVAAMLGVEDHAELTHHIQIWLFQREVKRARREKEETGRGARGAQDAEASRQAAAGGHAAV